MGARLGDVKIWLRSNKSRHSVNRLDSGQDYSRKMLAFIVTWLEAATTEIGSSKKTRETGDDVIVLLIVE